MDAKIVAVIASLICVSVVVGVYMMRRPKQEAPPMQPPMYAPQIAPLRPPPPPPATAAPPPPTTPSVTPPTATINTAYLSDLYYYRYGLPPLPPAPSYVVHGWDPQFQLVPGAAWPALVGRHRDTVVTYLMNTYPRLVVRALPSDTPVKYGVRSDRITLQYDTDTRRVVSARIG
jgi:hypothetical protein